MISLPVQLPPGFTSLVTTGDTIRTGQTIAQKTTTNEQVINISEQLGIPIKKVKNVLKKNPGDEVKEGDVIAVKKGFLGFDSHRVISRVNGVVDRYQRDSGNLIIKTGSQVMMEKLVSPVDGTITLCDNKKIVIETEKNIALAQKGSGQAVRS